MIDAGHPRRDALPRRCDVVGQVRRRALNAVAQPDRLDGRRLADGPAGHGHGVGVLQQPGVGTDGLHVPADVQEHRDGAQRLEDAAGAHGIRHRLVDAVAQGDGVVDGWLVADPDRRDDVVGVVEGLRPVCGGVHGVGAAVVGGEPLGVSSHKVEPLLVDVHQGDVGSGQRRRLHHVLQEPPGEDDAAGADEGDLGQSCTSPEEPIFARSSPSLWRTPRRGPVGRSPAGDPRCSAGRGRCRRP